MNGPELLKETLSFFWKEFGYKKNNGRGFSEADKINTLIQMSRVVIPYKRQQGLVRRRKKFDAVKSKLHPWRRFGGCFCCGKPATDRHHIVQLQNGGINSKKNVVSLCFECHSKIHPWLSLGSSLKF